MYITAESIQEEIRISNMFLVTPLDESEVRGRLEDNLRDYKLPTEIVESEAYAKLWELYKDTFLGICGYSDEEDVEMLLKQDYDNEDISSVADLEAYLIRFQEEWL